MSGLPPKLGAYLGLLGILCLLTPATSGAGAPTDQVRTTVDKALAVIKNPDLKLDGKNKERRRQQLREAIYPRFDFTEMAKRSLGSHWRRRTPEEQKQFVATFTDLLENAYVSRIEAYDDEKFVYTRETIEDKNFAQVDSRIITQQGDEFAISYKLHLVGGEWKIYDIVVENISLVNNYRSQFNRIISNSSYEELIRRMREKQADVAGGEKDL